MQIIENDKIKEKVYTKKLENGLTIMVVPKKGCQKRYIIWGVNYGSVDNHFFINDEEFYVPDGIAHYLEHKMFEQRNGKNSLDVLTALGVDANAYTTNNFTAYLFESTDNFYEALDEFMDYVQNPYYTDENVEKERGIIEQEIVMYDDYPEWAMYMNAMKLMYHNNPIKIDIAGTKETISKINKEDLYRVYNNFYVPENMVIVLCGDIDEKEAFEELEKRIIIKSNPNEVRRIVANEPENIVEKRKEINMDISMPIFTVAYKDKILDNKEMIKKDLAMEIIFNIIIGNSSNLYKRLYEQGLIFSEFGFDFEFARNYSHVYIQGQTFEVEKVINELKNEFDYYINQGIAEKDFVRIKRKIYGNFVKGFNDISNIGNNLINKYFKGSNLFDYIEEFESLNKEYVEEVLRNVFREDKKVISIVNPLKNEEENQ